MALLKVSWPLKGRLVGRLISRSLMAIKKSQTYFAATAQFAL
jgi:hypothetical protein